MPKISCRTLRSADRHRFTCTSSGHSRAAIPSGDSEESENNINEACALPWSSHHGPWRFGASVPFLSRGLQAANRFECPFCADKLVPSLAGSHVGEVMVITPGVTYIWMLSGEDIITTVVSVVAFVTVSLPSVMRYTIDVIRHGPQPRRIPFLLIWLWGFKDCAIGVTVGHPHGTNICDAVRNGTDDPFCDQSWRSSRLATCTFGMPPECAQAGWYVTVGFDAALAMLFISSSVLSYGRPLTD